MIDQNEKIYKIIEIIDEKIHSRNYKDSVHKIKLMTAREIIFEIISK
tara:strand:+ start:249 stop:389 length:141 start_codon:yes stop_codon:yes gene_type:complete